jgi:hypothetical protein
MKRSAYKTAAMSPVKRPCPRSRRFRRPVSPVCRVSLARRGPKPRRHAPETTSMEHRCRPSSIDGASMSFGAARSLVRSFAAPKKSRISDSRGSVWKPSHETRGPLTEPQRPSRRRSSPHGTAGDSRDDGAALTEPEQLSRRRSSSHGAGAALTGPQRPSLRRSGSCDAGAALAKAELLNRSRVCPNGAWVTAVPCGNLRGRYRSFCYRIETCRSWVLEVLRPSVGVSSN